MYFTLISFSARVLGVFPIQLVTSILIVEGGHTSQEFMIPRICEPMLMVKKLPSISARAIGIMGKGEELPR